MPRYFFDVHNDGQDARDDEGSDLASDVMAESEAIGVILELARSLVIEQGHGELEVTARAGKHVIFRAKLVLTTERT